VFVNVIAVGCVKVTELVFKQPFASVMVAVYVPGPKLETEGVVAPPGDHDIK
jgi:hypothetical protein